MRAELRRLQLRLGIPFIHVTHGQDEALALADLVVVMNKGKIEQAGSPREVFEKPATEFIARFLGGHNVIETPAGTIAVRADRTSVLAANSNTARMKAKVSGVEYQGATYHVALESNGADGSHGNHQRRRLHPDARRDRRGSRPRLERRGHSRPFPRVMKRAGFVGGEDNVEEAYRRARQAYRAEAS